MANFKSRAKVGGGSEDELTTLMDLYEPTYVETVAAVRPAINISYSRAWRDTCSQASRKQNIRNEPDNR